MEKGSFKNGSTFTDSQRRLKRESLNTVIKQQISKTRKEIIEEKMRHTKDIIQKAERIVARQEAKFNKKKSSDEK